MKKLTTPYFCFMLFLAAFIMYVMNTMLDFALSSNMRRMVCRFCTYVFLDTHQYRLFLGMSSHLRYFLLTVVFYYLLARQFVRNFDSISDNKDQIEAAFTILYSNY
jgi:hypothetical protein